MDEVDTPDAMLSGEASSSTPPPPDISTLATPYDKPDGRWGRRGNALGVLFAVMGALMVASLLVPAQWAGRVLPGHSVVDDGAVALKPGSAQGTGSRVFIDDLDTFEPDGQVLFTTVAIDDQVSVFEWVEARFDDDFELRPREEVFGTRSATEQRERNLELMAVSKDNAVIAALEHLGVDAVIESGIGFNAVLEGGPVDGRLEVGEIIIGLDGEAISGFESLRTVLDGVEPGDVAMVTVEHFETGATREIEFVYGSHPEGIPGGFIGISDVTVRAVDADLPFEIEIDSGSIGGPSAGLAFTLTLLDLLTEGELTGGNDVAVTGTITGDGFVGNVGGVEQKAAAAADRGAKVFIVPAELAEAARAHAGSMPVIGVATLEEALEALADLGGDVDLEFQLPG